MKTLRIKTILIVIISIMLWSCSSDDDEDSEFCPKVMNTHPLLLGEWIFTGTFTNGEIFTEDCDLLTTLKVTCDTLETKSFGGNNCTDSQAYILSFRIEGDNLISLDESGNDIGTQIIILLNETTLILQNDFAIADNVTENWERQ